MGAAYREANPRRSLSDLERAVQVGTIIRRSSCYTSLPYESSANDMCKSIRSRRLFHSLSISIFSPQTDDCGVFKTSLSKELSICAETLRLSKADVVSLTVNANRFSFASDLERQLIADTIRDFVLSSEQN